MTWSENQINAVSKSDGRLERSGLSDEPDEVELTNE